MTRAALAAGILLALLLAPHARAEPSYDEQFRQARDAAVGGRRAEAIELYTRLLKRSPGNSDVLLGRGRVYAWEGRWTEAEADLQTATKRSPRYADAWSALGDMYRWSDRPALAAKAYGHWIALKPNEAEPYLARARVRRNAGDIDGARADIESARARGADAAEVQRALGALETGALGPDAVAAGYDWSASVSATRAWVNGPRREQNDETVSLRRHFDNGSLALEWLAAHRFGLDDQAWALDGYVGLWHRAYANLRYQRGPNVDLFPEHSGRIEVYQGVGRGWELAASLDRLQFPNSDVNIYGAAVGKYRGNWYLRGRTTYVDGNNSSSVGFRAQARYYYAGDADSYVEAAGGTGRSEETDVLTATSLATTYSSGSLTLVNFFTPRFGFKLSAAYADEPAQVERSVTGALYTRW